ncbi:glycosyltransferase [Tabrizicola sp.]|uniref:glycosyltransferase n=1 Tax=Tabrizicola sp. TaxID=2005166 RepID=UPI0027336911|nr:glycosyltransferase [Tabrizicola sp.]MDP3197356.1 glycosyltransferase [Tabrizicola sp.]
MTSKAIVLGITADLAFAAGTLLASIRAQDPACDATVLILHDGLDMDQQEALGRVWPGCRFRVFDTEAAVARLGTASEQVAGFLKHYSALVLAKLDLPELLAEFDKVLWLDADILVRGRLDGLWDFDCLAWRSLPDGAFKRREKALGVFADLKLDPSVPLLNGGVIGLSRRFVELGGSSTMLRGFARRLAGHAPSSQIDELPWYLAAASRAMPVTVLPMALNHPVGAKGADAAVVVHAIGAHKFWNCTPLLQLFPDWSRHQETWVAQGGRPYAGEVLLAEVHPVEPHEVFRAAQARAHWLAVFEDLRPVLPRGMVVDLRHDQKHLRIFLHARPETEHLRLHRHANEKRIGLEAILPPDLQARTVEAVCSGVKGARHEKGALVSVPLTQIGAALAATDAVLELSVSP